VLERKFGSNADSMTLELRDIAENFICSMGNDAETLAHYGPQEGYTIHVTNYTQVYFEFRLLTPYRVCWPN
jgi:hypothetical protein